MLTSMTGYGKADFENEKLRITIEVKSLNAKYIDISLSLPEGFSEKEIALRNLVTTQLKRGKITLDVNYQSNEQARAKTKINERIFKTYYKTLQALADDVGATSAPLFSLALQGPEVITENTNHTTAKKDWYIVEKVTKEALQRCVQARQEEGKILAAKLLTYVHTIKHALQEVAQLDALRIDKTREKLYEKVSAIAIKERLDENRFEQELIYYLEKLDISEEKVRLEKHLAYFEEVMEHGSSEGKKLGFIAQEIGREINTISAKAKDAAIHKNAILMKDELERIKEQLQNIL